MHAMQDDQTSADRCAAGCDSCPLGADQGREDADAPAGGRLVLLSAAAFLSPLLQAVIGAIVAPIVWDNPHSRSAGALIGLALGLVDSWFVARLIKKARDKHT